MAPERAPWKGGRTHWLRAARAFLSLCRYPPYVVERGALPLERGDVNEGRCPSTPRILNHLEGVPALWYPAAAKIRVLSGRRTHRPDGNSFLGREQASTVASVSERGAEFASMGRARGADTHGNRPFGCDINGFFAAQFESSLTGTGTWWPTSIRPHDGLRLSASSFYE